MTEQIEPPPAITPIFSPAVGTYAKSASVTLSDATPGANIHFTTDGSTPTNASPIFSKSFAIDKTTTIKAIAVATGYSASPIATATYTIK